jgi:hypothetical protein
MYAVLAANHINLYSTLHEAMFFAINWNEDHQDKTARVFAPEVHNGRFHLANIIEAENDEDYQHKLSDLWEGQLK